MIKGTVTGPELFNMKRVYGTGPFDVPRKQGALQVYR